VLPVALGFVDSLRGGLHDGPLFVGDTTLVSSIWSTLCADGVQAQVRYGETQPPRGRDRRTWSHDLRVEIQRLCGQLG
jgi:1-acyl-sn-glycerol-3-phosphate acyltransferase